MLQLTPQMRLLVAVSPVDFRSGIDGLCRLCREALSLDPFSGAVFVFRNRRATSVKLLAYDGQGFWLCQKRLSEGKFKHWPVSCGQVQRQLLSHELSVLLAGGDPERTRAAPQWRRVSPPEQEGAQEGLTIQAKGSE
jgi:transposase